jgi:hypothetical protein
VKHLNPPARLAFAAIFELIVLFAVTFLDINYHFQAPVVYTIMIIATAIAAYIFVDLNG